MPQGMIMKGISGFYYVKVDTSIYECKARGIFRNKNKTPLIGDLVEISIENNEKLKGNIEKIYDRTNELIRPAVANVNQMVLMISIKTPKPDLLLADKLLISAHTNNIEPLIVINKLDLDNDNEHEKILEVYSSTNYEIILLSSKLEMGFNKLNEKLKNKITVFAGQSGVGKSTALNKIMNEVIMETGTVSSKIGRGKHTTRHAELIELKCGGYILDTPGFSNFEAIGIKAQELELYFPEFNEYLNSCKFRGCSHIKEIECKIKSAKELKKISNERYENYCTIYNLLKQNEKNKY